MDNREIDILIIGGGISGLYILNQLVKENKNLNIRLFERNSNLGGRIQTQYLKNKKVKFELGAWRFHHSHTRLKKLIEELNLKYDQTTSSKNTSITGNINICSASRKITQKKRSKINNTVEGLSYYDTLILNQNICEANNKNSYSKIPLIMDSTINVYDVNLKDKGSYYVLKKGFSEIFHQLSFNLKGYIQTNHYVLNITKTITNEYNIHYQIRDNNNFENKIIKSKYIFICIPPEYITDWDIVKNNLLPLVYSVGTIPLHHIYGYSKNLKKFNSNSFQFFTNSPLSQIISGDFYNNWFQVSYSGGKLAEYWNRLKMLNPNLLLKELNKNLLELKLNIQVSQIESYYWENAIHYWIPNYNFNLEKNVENSIYPHPINLPNLFYAGEAFSSHQGWMEGALETSNLALDKFFKVKQNDYIFNEIKFKKNYEYVILDNRVLDVKKWKKCHPGSQQAIQNHLYEDISQLFRIINHKNYSWAIVNNIQTYWVKDRKIGYFL